MRIKGVERTMKVSLFTEIIWMNYIITGYRSIMRRNIL